MRSNNTQTPIILEKRIPVTSSSRATEAVVRTALSSKPRLVFAKQRLEQLIYVAIDVTCVVLGVWASVLLLGVPLQANPSLASEYLGWVTIYAVLVVVSCELEHLYRRALTASGIGEMVAVTRATLWATIAANTFLYLSHSINISGSVLIMAGALNTISLNLWRYGRRSYLNQRKQRGLDLRNVLLIGEEDGIVELARYFKAEESLGLFVRKSMIVRSGIDSRSIIAKLPELIRSEYIDTIFYASISADPFIISELQLLGRNHRVDVKVIPELYRAIGWQPPLDYAGEVPFFHLHRAERPSLSLLIKRILDVGISLVTLLCLSPVILLTAVLIKLDSEGPVLYVAQRIGRRGTPFRIFKFRTMYRNADQQLKSMRHLNERNGVWFKVKNDPRITRVGAWLRKYSLDEIPQFWNVLRGDMSIVGPRPAEVEEVRSYDVHQLQRLDAVPGITGLWQVTARSDPSFEKYLALDLSYIENWSLWLDLKIMAKTIPVVIRGTGQ